MTLGIIGFIAFALFSILLDDGTLFMIGCFWLFVFMYIESIRERKNVKK